MKQNIFLGTSVIISILIVVYPAWSINRISLSQVQTSFVGEAPQDWANNPACLGDVNGDGYDDFLVGAMFNDYGGKDVGQVYLFFGRSNGWTQYTNLSEADASFIGEMIDGYVGSPISGAGDVNGDGYSDFLIGDPDYYLPAEVPANFRRGITYLMLGMSTVF